jgi:hypothetical protein
VSVQARAKPSDEGRLPNVDIAKGEATEKELDALIRRRHNHRVVEERERPAEEAWMESERRYSAQSERTTAPRGVSTIRTRLPAIVQPWQPSPPTMRARLRSCNGTTR